MCSSNDNIFQQLEDDEAIMKVKKKSLFIFYSCINRVEKVRSLHKKEKEGDCIFVI